MKIARRVARAGIGAVAIAGSLAMTALPAQAETFHWRTTDRDNISRAVSSGRAYTTSGVGIWQTSGHGFNDYRFGWGGRLNLHGAHGSCARLRVITTLAGGKISKRFPRAGSTKFGYYTYCSASGSGSRYLSGSDISSARFAKNATKISSAHISVCYAPNSRTPNTQCYNFVIHPGD